MNKLTFILALTIIGTAACSGSTENANVGTQTHLSDQSESTSTNDGEANLALTTSTSEVKLPTGGEDIEAYLKDNGITDYQKTDNGIYYTVSKKGSGATPGTGDFVEVHYTGKLMDGTVFDSSVERGEPIVFQLGVGRVISGWDQGIPLFNIGGAGTLYLPSDLAYGASGAGNVIPPNANLIFDVEVISVMDEASYKAYQTKMMEKQQEEHKKMAAMQNEKDEQLIADYLKTNNLKATRTESGLYVVVETQGSGERAVAGKSISVHYTGKLLNGTKFDSSVDRGEPFEFQLGAGRVIKGWDEGLTHFNVGGKGKLLIPSSLGYGQRAAGSIPPNSVLLFDVEVMGLK